MAGDLARDVLDVGGALPHGVGVGGLEALTELPRDLRESPFRVDVVALDPVEDGLQVRLVRRDQAVRLENGRELRADVAGRLS